MKRIANFIVEKNRLLLVLMLVLTAVCGLLIQKVEVNSDMTKYLADISPMKQGLDIMEAEFPDSETANAIHVMFRDLPREQAETVFGVLKELPNVTEAAYDPDSQDYNRDGCILFELTTACDYGSKEVKAIEDTILEQYSGYDVVVETDENVSSLPPSLVAAALVILLIILFIMCGSWFEPVIFMAVIGVAVVINMGTNVIFGSVSNVTFSIAAILQLVLSMDYSIILMNRYRQEIHHEMDHKRAMKDALVHAFSSVTSSAFTTFVGLLMLVFMNFKIGQDLGLVLAKGVLCSLVCVFMVLPGLILLFDGLLYRTAKKSPHIPTGGVASVSYRFRRPLALLFVVLLVGSYLLQTLTPISFGMEPPSQIAEVFPKSNPVVILYDNADSAQIQTLTERLEADPNVTAAVSYPTTLGCSYSAEELEAAVKEMAPDTEFDLDSSMLRLLYYHCYMNGEAPSVTMSALLRFLADDVVTSDTFAEQLDESVAQQAETLRNLADGEALTQPMTAKELATFLGQESLDGETLQQILLLYFLENGGVDAGTMTLPEFVTFVTEDLAQDETYAALLDGAALSQMGTLTALMDAETTTTPLSCADMAAMLAMDESQLRAIYLLRASQQGNTSGWKLSPCDLVAFLTTNPDVEAMLEPGQAESLTALNDLMDTVISGELCTPEALAALLQDFGADIDQNTMELLCLFYGSRKEYDESWTMSMEGLFDHLAEQVVPDERFSAFLGEDFRAQIQDYRRQLQEGIAQLKGENHAILMLSTRLPTESDETMAFLDGVAAACDEILEHGCYLIGTSAMYREMKNGFSQEMLFITLLTAGAIFVIVALTFRSLVIPLFLVLIVLCGVYVTVAFSGLRGQSLIYLAYIIVQCILMGATIDYGILFTNCYREHRQTRDVKGALVGAYGDSIHTILTSGLIMVLVTGIIGAFSDNPSIAPICTTISLGALSAILLILFVLPGMLATFDRVVARKRK